MQCRNCQEYGHTHKFCQMENDPRCGKCARDGHEIVNCTQNEARCYHCDGQHTSFNRKCQEYIFHAEVKNIQQKKRVSRREAIMIVKDRYPQIKTTYVSKLQLNVVQTKGSSLNKEPFYIQSSYSATGQTERLNPPSRERVHNTLPYGYSGESSMMSGTSEGARNVNREKRYWKQLKMQLVLQR